MRGDATRWPLGSLLHPAVAQQGVCDSQRAPRGHRKREAIIKWSEALMTAVVDAPPTKKRKS